MFSKHTILVSDAWISSPIRYSFSWSYCLVLVCFQTFSKCYQLLLISNIVKSLLSHLRLDFLETLVPGRLAQYIFSYHRGHRNRPLYRSCKFSHTLWMFFLARKKSKPHCHNTCKCSLMTVWPKLVRYLQFFNLALYLINNWTNQVIFWKLYIKKSIYAADNKLTFFLVSQVLA